MNSLAIFIVGVILGDFLGIATMCIVEIGKESK